MVVLKKIGFSTNLFVIVSLIFCFLLLNGFIYNLLFSNNYSKNTTKVFSFLMQLFPTVCILVTHYFLFKY